MLRPECQQCTTYSCILLNASDSQYTNPCKLRSADKVQGQRLTDLARRAERSSWDCGDRHRPVLDATAEDGHHGVERVAARGLTEARALHRCPEERSPQAAQLRLHLREVLWRVGRTAEHARQRGQLVGRYAQRGATPWQQLLEWERVVGLPPTCSKPFGEGFIKV